MLQSRSGSLACTIGLLHALAVFAFAARVWIRRRAKRWSVDDYTYTAAFILAIAHAALLLFCIVHGYDRRVEDIPRSELESIRLARYAAQFLYILSFGLGRIACALFVGTVARESPVVWPARTTAGLAGLWTVACVICLALKGNRIEPWTALAAESRPGLEPANGYVSTPVSRRHPGRPLVPFRYRPSSPWFALVPLLLAEAALAASVVTGCATAPRRLRAALVPESDARLSKTVGDCYYPLDGRDEQQRQGWRARVGKPWTRARVPTPDLSWQPYQGFTDVSEDTAYPPRVHISSDRATLSTEGGTAAKEQMLERTELPAPPMKIHRTTEVIIEYTLLLCGYGLKAASAANIRSPLSKFACGALDEAKSEMALDGVVIPYPPPHHVHIHKYGTKRQDTALQVHIQTTGPRPEDPELLTSP
ncbi:hypothetical protein CCM_01569 [Cordyceps militaris CM01]|uniref:Rhodopsin domain-containing protein n=1 Tax=Cordyceps militaris (strain CM01) TaxID=983644 RepID=G3J5V9_CORMM|nr:uncharacterized protein CCM_01569 [Cordyceps militaris CM01]EGX96911.1 hypothetical protein CCM_01569 [Cordyceps militaris CM01]